MEDKEDKEKSRERERGGEGVQHIRPVLKTWTDQAVCDHVIDLRCRLRCECVLNMGRRRVCKERIKEDRKSPAQRAKKWGSYKDGELKQKRCSETYNSHRGSVCHPRSQRPAPSRPRPRGWHSARPHETGLESQPPPQPEPEARERERTAHNRETIAKLFL